MPLRFPYLVRPSPVPVYPLGGALTRSYPIFPVDVTGMLSHKLGEGLLDSGSDDTILPANLAPVLGVDLHNAPEGEAKGMGGLPLRYRYATVRLHVTDLRDTCEWDAIVGFVNLPLRRLVLGRTGFLQYFDTKLLGLGAVVELEPNASFPGQHTIH